MDAGRRLRQDVGRIHHGCHPPKKSACRQPTRLHSCAPMDDSRVQCAGCFTLYDREEWYGWPVLEENPDFCGPCCDALDDDWAAHRPASGLPELAGEPEAEPEAEPECVAAPTVLPVDAWRGGGAGALPRAHSCFNMVDVPCDADSEQQLRRRLAWALEQAEGFAFA